MVCAKRLITQVRLLPLSQINTKNLENMENQINNPNATPNATPNGVQMLAGAEVSFTIPSTASLGKLSDMEPDFSLDLKYRTADDWASVKGQEIRAFFMGFKEIPNSDGELVTCAVFVTKTECFIAGQKLLIEAVRQLEHGTAVAITYVEKKNNKSTEGATMVFSVKTLK